MKPSLYIHIGAAKCGSSAIQAFLSTNRKELLARNIVVPDEKLGFEGPFSGNQIWLFEYLREDVEVNKEVLRRRLFALLEKAKNKENAKIIVSAENLSNRHGFHHLFAGLHNEFDIRVIFYIRRQDEYLTSAWQQWYVKKYPDFWSWVLYSISRKGQWYHDIEPWLSVFGKDAIVVRRFARQYLVGEDLLRDFASVAGIEGEEINFDVGDRNPSYSDAVTELAHAVQDMFKDIHDNDFYQMVAEWAGSAAFRKQPSQLLTVQQRHALMDCYRESNDRMKKEFFPEVGEEEDLFQPIRRGPTDGAAQGLIDPHTAMLMRLVYGNYKEIRKVRKALKALEHIVELPERLVGGNGPER